MDQDIKVVKSLFTILFESMPPLKIHSDIVDFSKKMAVVNKKIVSPSNITRYECVDRIFQQWVNENFYINSHNIIVKNNHNQKTNMAHTRYVNFVEWIDRIFFKIDYTEHAKLEYTDTERYIHELVRKILFLCTRKLTYLDKYLSDDLNTEIAENSDDMNRVTLDSFIESVLCRNIDSCSIDNQTIYIYDDVMAMLKIPDDKTRNVRRYGTLCTKDITYEDNIIYFTIQNNIQETLNKYFELNKSAHEQDFEIKKLVFDKEKKHSAAKIGEIVKQHNMVLPANAYMCIKGNKFVYISNGHRRDMKYSYLCVPFSEIKNIKVNDSMLDDNLLILCKDKTELSKYSVQEILSRITDLVNN